MSFTDAVSTCLTTKFATFSGRARRSEYWWFALFTVLVSLVANVLDRAIGGQWISLVVSLALLVPSLAVAWRRLHDTGRTGAWYFLVLIPLIGAIVLIVFFVQDSQPGANQYGPSPKGEGSHVAA